MTAGRIDGKARAAEMRQSVAEQVAQRTAAGKRPPCLAVVLVGEDPASQVYVRNKTRACEKAGMGSVVRKLPATATPAELKSEVDALNANPEVDGFLVQLPVPDGIRAADVRSWIDPHKDVDGLHPENMGLLAAGTPRFVPCTPAGCLDLLRAYDVPTSGRRAVVVGRSLIVGRPLSILMSSPGVDATVSVAHSRTPDVKELCREADLLLVAAGVAGLVGPDHVRPGAVVIDVGIHRVEDPKHPKGFRLVGDVQPSVAEVASLLTPVPGGVGPMTVAMLLANTLRAQELAEGHDAS